MSGAIKRQILQYLKFKEGNLSVKYLGLLLVSTSIKRKHYQNLVDKITARQNCCVLYNVQIGVVNNARCNLCQHHEESMDHLFFKCSFSSRVWSVILQKCHIQRAGLLFQLFCCHKALNLFYKAMWLLEL